MKIRDSLRLIMHYCILDDNDVNNFRYDIKDPRLEEKAGALLVRRNTERCRAITTHEYADLDLLRIIKKTSFSRQDDVILEKIIAAINRLKDSLSYHELYMTLANTQLDALLESICDESGDVPILDGGSREIIANFIMKMEEWSSQTYENHKISFALGMDPWTNFSSDIHVRDLYDDPMFKVLGSGRETIIVCNKDGEIIGYERLPEKAVSRVPLSFGRAGEWSKNRLVVILTLLGEIMILFDQRLMYLKHDSRWYSGHNSPLIRIMSEACGYDAALNNALIDTCLDVSFRRCGACLGIVEPDCPLIFDVDRFRSADSPRARFFRQMVGQRKFQELDREIRQELAAIDGATVMDKSGSLIAIGAILMVRPKKLQARTTGGRSMAARQLADYGIGIKISEDGSMEAWRKSCEGPVKKFIEIL